MVRGAKWLFGLSDVALVGATGTFLDNAGSAANEVKNHGDRLDKLEKALTDEQKARTDANEQLVELVIDKLSYREVSVVTTKAGSLE